MHKVVLLEKVKKDFKTIISFISEDNPVYAINTIDSIMATINILEEFPYI
jgi:plasmid stabilization system protein ParE